MRVCVALLIAVMALALSAVPVAAQQAQPPAARFTSSVDVVSVTAVVRDRRGRFVPDLERGDFTVIESGEIRPVLDVRVETDGPVRIALLVDVSGSMRLSQKAADARQAARHIFSALRSEDEAALYAFDTQLDRVLDFTPDVGRLEAALDRMAPPYGQTSLYDAIAATAREVAGDPGATPGTPVVAPRLAIVVLTDGVDTSSRLTPAQVSGIASGIDVPVYVLAVMPSIDDPRNVPGGPAASAASELGSLSRWTGGELFTASSPAHASVAARQIVGELRHQYVLAFAASSRPGWRPVEIRARNRSHTVRARAGYTAGGTDGA